MSRGNCYGVMVAWLLVALLVGCKAAPTPTSTPDPASIPTLTSAPDPTSTPTMTAVPNPAPVFSTSEPPASSEGQIPPASDTPPLPIVEPVGLTFADNGQTVMLKTGSQFTLELSAGYAWTLMLPDQQVLRLVSESPKSQDIAYRGLFEALQPGQVELSASGEPFCRQSRPACAIPSVLFKITIIVE